MEWNVGVMLWRIGDLLDMDAQMDWILEQGFEAVAFHAAPGKPATWKGIDPATTDGAERSRWRKRIESFQGCEVHAPFRITIHAEDGDQMVEDAIEILQFSGEIGADVVTIHAVTPGGNHESQLIANERIDPAIRNQPQEARLDAYLQALNTLNAHSKEAGVIAVLELDDGFEFIDQVDHTHLAVNLDVGHAIHKKFYEPFGGFRQMVEHIGPHLAHCHIHDSDLTNDHIEIGTGVGDFDVIMESFATVNYTGFFAMEPDPDWVSPEGIVRGRDLLKGKMRNDDAGRDRRI